MTISTSSISLLCWVVDSSQCLGSLTFYILFSTFGLQSATNMRNVSAIVVSWYSCNMSQCLFSHISTAHPPVPVCYCATDCRPSCVCVRMYVCAGGRAGGRASGRASGWACLHVRVYSYVTAWVMNANLPRSVRAGSGNQTHHGMLVWYIIIWFFQRHYLTVQ